MTLDRRHVLALAAGAVAAPGLAGHAAAQPGPVQAAVARFAALPATTSCLVVAEHPTAPWRAAHDPGRRMFVGSAVKTFILAQFLREVEAGRLKEDDLVTVDDKVRSASSPVFLQMTGKTAARSALEAMIAHSDNTATDISIGAAGPDKVRALIAEAGLGSTQIPDSTRRLFSWLAGAAEGVDIGWDGILRMEKNESFGTPRQPLNDTQTMASTAEDMIRWYQAALKGRYFTKPETLTEFKRIHAMADALPRIVPPDTVAYGKGGSIDWQDFHCFSVPGQMIVNRVPVTFCFTVNWTGPDGSVGTMAPAFVATVSDVLKEAAAAV
jgi:beta-lactamase class A